MSIRCSPRPAARRARAGFTLIELCVATAVLVIGVLGLVSSISTSVRLVGLNRESTVAHEAARALCERLQATPFAQIFARYNADPADDPDGPGTAPGASFAVPGLGVRDGDLDGAVGEVLFPTELGLGLDLDEGVVDAGFGMPRDLDGDGFATPGPLPGGYTLLPVRVRLRWGGQNGDRELALDSLLVAP